MKELWLDILGLENYYQISNTGKIKNKNGKLLKPYLQNGYLRIGLFKNNKTKSFYIHRLVATAFIKNKENKPIINHIDGNKLNNSVNNLEWCTYAENNQHAYKYKLKIPKILLGEESPHHKLNKQDIKYIRSHWNYNTKELAKKFNISTTHVRRIVKNECWKY